MKEVMKGFANKGTSTQPHMAKAAYLRQRGAAYLRQRGKPEFRMADNKPAKEKNMEVINAMSMFCFGKAYVGILSRYTYLRLIENGKSKDIDVQPMVGHDNHLHVSKFKKL